MGTSARIFTLQDSAGGVLCFTGSEFDRKYNQEMSFCFNVSKNVKRYSNLPGKLFIAQLRLQLPVFSVLKDISYLESFAING
jgi:hypothetical protein